MKFGSGRLGVAYAPEQSLDLENKAYVVFVLSAHDSISLISYWLVRGLGCKIAISIHCTASEPHSYLARVGGNFPFIRANSREIDFKVSGGLGDCRYSF